MAEQIQDFLPSVALDTWRSSPSPPLFDDGGSGETSAPSEAFLDRLTGDETDGGLTFDTKPSEPVYAKTETLPLPPPPPPPPGPAKTEGVPTDPASVDSATIHAIRAKMLDAMKLFRKAEYLAMDGSRYVLSRRLTPIAKIHGWNRIPAAYFENESPIEIDPRLIEAEIVYLQSIKFDTALVFKAADASQTLSVTDLAGLGLSIVYPDEAAKTADRPLYRVEPDGPFSRVFGASAGRIFHPILLKINAKYIQLANSGLCSLNVQIDSRGNYVAQKQRSSDKDFQKSRKILLKAVSLGCELIQARREYLSGLLLQYMETREAFALKLMSQSSDVCPAGYTTATGETNEDQYQLVRKTDADLFDSIVYGLYVLANY